MHEALSMLDNGRPVGDTHEPLWAADPKWTQDREIITTVRDPWGWYASFYLHALKTGHGADLFGCYAGYDPESPFKYVEEARHQPEKLFRDVLYGMTHPSSRPIPENPGLIWPMTARGLWASRWRSSGLGLCSAIFRSMLASEDTWGRENTPNHSIEVIRTDRLTDWLKDNFHGYDRNPVNTNVESWGRKINTTKWYTHEMHQWVMRADAELIREYEFSL